MHVLRAILLTALIFCLSLPAEAQTLASGSITTNGQSVTAGLLNADVTGVSIQISGTWTGTITFQGSTDGSTFVSLLSTNVTSGASAASTTANGVFSASNAGYRTIRATATAAMTGTAVVSISQGFATGGGGGAGGSVTQGTDPWIVGDGAGALNVICDSGCAGGTQYTQDAALTVATTVGTMAMGRASAAVPTDVSADNDAVIPWFLRSGASVTQPTFGGVLAVAGNGASGTGVQRVTVANDSTGILAGVTTVTTLSTLTGGGVAAGAVDSGNPIKVGGIYSSALPTLDNGDRGNLQLTAGGALITAPSLTGAFATDVTFGTTTYTEASSTGPLNGAVRNDTIDALANTTNEAIPLTTNEVGALWVAKRDPCSWKAKSYYVVNLAATGTVEVANAVAGEFWYICSVNLVAQGANAFLIAHDDTDACGSITAGMNGGTTAATGWGFAANGGISLGNGDSAVLKSATANHYLCIAPSTTAQISGTIVYVSAP